MGEPGPWHQRLPHFRVDHVPASGDKLQTEYFVPRSLAVSALQALEQLGETLSGLLWLSEVRTIAEDGLWMSSSYQVPMVGIHFSWRNDWPALRKLLPVVEEALAPFEARPHWEKLFTLELERVTSHYPRLGDFRALVNDFDPQGKFRNAYLDR